MKFMGCSRSLFATFNVACRVRRFNVSRPAATSYPKNKEWDYFKGIIPTSAVASRRDFQGSRTLAEPVVDPLKNFKDLIVSGHELDAKLTHGSTDHKQDFPKLTDGSADHKEVHVDVLKWKHLFLFFSSLENSDPDYFKILKSVYDEVTNRGRPLRYGIVWIPVVEKWDEKEQKDFEMLRAKNKMPWYTVQCSSPILEKTIKEKWGYKSNKPILVVMKPNGDVKINTALPFSQDKGMNFLFGEAPN